MDALTHGIIGIAVAGLSGQPPTYDNPIYLAALLGSQAPDFDIIAIARGGVSYLKQHRAASHSLPGVIGWATLIAAGLSLFVPETSPVMLWFWALAGTFSHVIMDYFNTHGAALLWPYRKERLSSNLLNVFDPILLLLLLIPYGMGFKMQQVSLFSINTIALYISLRYFLRQMASQWLTTYFARYTIERIMIMPSLKKLWFWDFVLEAKDDYFVGRIGIVSRKITICANLPKQRYSLIVEQAQKTTLAEFFNLFTPFAYFEARQQEGTTLIQIFDLRYYQKNGFLHSGLIVFKGDETATESYMRSYGRQLKFPA